jgi:transaldolase
MQIYIDTTNADDIRRARALGLIQGVTTNPGSFGEGGNTNNPLDLLRQVLAAADGLPVFVQVRGRTPEEQLAEARALHASAPNLVIKVVMDQVGLRSIPLMVKDGLQVSATAVNTVARAILAGECGAHYMIPYYGWLEDALERPTCLIEDIAAVYRAQGYTTRMHIFCRRMGDVILAAKAGAWGVLLESPDLARFFDHPQSAVAIDSQCARWAAKYGSETTWLDFLQSAAGKTK